MCVVRSAECYHIMLLYIFNPPNGGVKSPDYEKNSQSMYSSQLNEFTSFKYKYNYDFVPKVEK
jgi:hypothetical protein